MSNTSANHHGQASDKFESYIPEGLTYGVIKINNADAAPAITIFTPSGLNCAADYLRELRNDIDSVIAAFVDLGAVEE